MRDVLKLGLRLFIITFVVAALLGGAYLLTKEPIARQRAEAEEAARKTVLPDAELFVELPAEKIKTQLTDMPEKVELIAVYAGLRLIDSRVEGYALQLSTVGYGGKIELTIGIRYDGEICGIKVDSHSETAGLGARLTEHSFLSQFRDLNVFSSVTLDRDAQFVQKVDAITSATITSQAVVRAVNGAIYIYGILES